MSEPAYKRIGDYEVMRELGRGGMGRVYKVRNVISDRVEAMKILLPELAGRQELAARFLREIKLVASLEHPNIAQLRTAMTVDDQLIMVMEFVEGTSLDNRIDEGPVAPADAVSYTRQVLAALGYAHARGVVHRDIKPANMMVEPDGTVKVMDFGIAFSGSEHKLTSTGTTLGSLAYMSPEQVKGEATDGRSDLYSLGISLYEMVTGQRPFKADSDYAIMAAHVKETPRAPMELQPGLPGSLNAIILQSIAKEPSQRFQSAEAFAAALGSVVPVLGQTGVMPAVSDKTVVRPSGSFDAMPAATPAARSSATMHGMTPAPPPQAASAPRISATMMTPAMNSSGAEDYAGASSAAPPPPVSGYGHRGAYIALGAVLAIVMLVAAGTYYQSGATRSDGPPPAPTASSSTSAPSSQPASQASQPAAAAAPTDASSSAAAPAATGSGQSASGSGQSAAPTSSTSSAPASSSALAPSTATPKPTAKPNSTTQSASPPQQQAAPTQAAPASSAPSPASKPAEPDNSAALDEMERTLDQMESRMVAADTGIETLRRQQRAAGFDLRQDIATKQDAMKLNFNKAKQALQARDLARAKRFADLAESNLGAVEKFLGR